MKPHETDIKTLLALQQDVRTYAGNLINGASLQVNLGDRLAKKIFLSALLHCSEKKLKETNFVSDGRFREGSVNFNFSITSINSNYGDIFSLPNKLKFDDSNNCAKLLIREQKVINNCPFDTLISFEVIPLNVEIFCAFEERPEVTNLLVTRDNMLHRKRIYLQKNESSRIMLRYFMTAPFLVRSESQPISLI